MVKMHHPKVDRLYLARSEVGRQVQLELTFKTTNIGVNSYLTSTEDPLSRLVKQHEDRRKLYCKQQTTKLS